MPALSSLILSSAVLIDIFNSRIIEPQEIRSYYPENLLITLCKFLIKGMDKRDDWCGNRFQREFSFQNLLENKCDRRNKEFQCLSIIFSKPHTKSLTLLMLDLSLHLVSKYSVWSIILVFILPQNPFIWEIFQFCRYYYQDNPLYHHFSSY